MDSVNTPQHQYAPHLDTNSVSLQHQFSEMKAEIRQVKRMKHPNAYPTLPGNYRSFRTTEVLVICRRCNRVQHFAYISKANLMPPEVPTSYQNHQHNYIPHSTS